MERALNIRYQLEDEISDLTLRCAILRDLATALDKAVRQTDALRHPMAVRLTLQSLHQSIEPLLQDTQRRITRLNEAAERKAERAATTR